eukprot:TRINITY_DN261_c0_g1_i1.p2 TRINITY_DN261_c0_g1~~TRINITY_DN261_c0_g1_i1.p2  ORF type:complete len:269 (+),score=30.49 TRINITY_DN261_c0_g1_i1:1569-2375(+)
MDAGPSAPTTAAVQVTDLTFQYGERTVLDRVHFTLPRGSRCLLVGSNGAGKSTLLRVLGGKHLHRPDAVLVLGQSAFHSTPRALTYLGSEWRRSVAFTGHGMRYHSDIRVAALLKAVNGHAERKAYLLQLLGVNPSWRTHTLSDGELRRVQILLALIVPCDVLLLDEITVDLDVLTRMELLQFLKEETETRGLTVVYATHIFDGLKDWPTTLLRLKQDGSCSSVDPHTLEGPLNEVVADYLRTERRDLKAITNSPADPLIQHHPSRDA